MRQLAEGIKSARSQFFGRDENPSTRNPLEGTILFGPQIWQGAYSPFGCNVTDKIF